ncbi:MAG: PAS domain S-box protein [Syntrophaceae bacterium]
MTKRKGGTASGGIEAEAYRRRRMLERAQEIARVGYWEFDPEKAQGWASSETRRIYGLADETWTITAVHTIVLPEYHRALDEAMVELVKHGRNYDIEFKIRRLTDGARLDIHSQAEYDPDQHKVFGFIQDITARKQAEEKLKEANRRLEDIIEFLPDATFIIDGDKRIIAWNRAMEEMTGTSKHDILGRDHAMSTVPFYGEPRTYLMDLFDEDDEVLASQYDFIRRRGASLYAEVFTPALHDGKGAYVWAMACPLYDGAGNVVGAIESVREITESKLSEAALKESEERHRSLFENAIEGIFRTTFDGHVLMVNTSMARILGYETPQEVFEKVVDIASQVYADPLDRKDIVSRLIREGTVPGSEVLLKRADGGTVKALMNFRLVRDKQGQPTHIEGSCIDITAKWQAEEALKASEEKYRSIFENATEAIFQTTPQGTYLSANPALARMLGYASPEEMIDGIKDIGQELYVNPRECEELMRRLDEEGQVEGFETELYRKDRSRFWISMNIHTVRDKQGNIAYFEGTSVDIAERKWAQDALRASEARFRRLYDSIRDAFVSVDMDGMIIESNEVYRTMLGYEIEELKDLSYRDITPPKWHTFESRIIEKEVMARGYSDIYEKEYRRKDGTVFPVELRLYLLRDDEGQPAGMWAIVRDISERKRAEERLKEANRQLQNIIEFLPDATLITDGEQRIIAWNRAMEEMTGVSKADILGREHFEAMVPFYGAPSAFLIDYIGRGSAQIPSRYTDIRRKGDGIYAEVYSPILYRGRGAYIWAIAAPLYDGEGNIIGAIESIRDITERKRVEEELKESEARYRLLAENASDIIFTMDRDLRFTYISPCVQRLRGYAVEEAMRQKVDEILTPESLQRAMRVFQDELQAENGASHEWRKRTLELEEFCKDGSTIWTETTFTPLRDEAARLIGFLGITRDISERRQAEEKRKKLESQLAQAQKMESIGILAGGIAHDFNNILSPIMGFTELAKLKLEKGDRIEKELDEVLQAGLRARELVKQILTFSRKADIQKAPMDIMPLIKETIKFIRSSLPATIEIRQDLRLESAMIEADPVQIHQILMNLSSNAGYAMHPGGGVLSIRLSGVEFSPGDSHPQGLQPGRYVRLSVSDTGQGIPKAIIDSIFDPFFTTKPRGEGTGMGLSVIHGIVEDMRGAVSVDSKPDRGATFDILLPMIDVQEVAGIHDETGVDSRPHSGRILFVDDERAVLAAGGGLLERLGYQVVAADNPLEALRIFTAHSNDFDCVLTDLTMPKMSGIDLAERLKAIRPDIPIVLSTGLSLGLSEDRISRAGIREMVMKPMSAAELAQAVFKAMYPEHRDGG